MRCPFCAHEDSQVKDSRPSEDGAAIRRRRQCEGCGARFTTFERVQLRDLTVVKKDGKREPFDRAKLERAIGHVAYIRFASVYKDFTEPGDFADIAGKVGEQPAAEESKDKADKPADDG